MLLRSSKLRALIDRHKRHWLTIAFLLGFVVDNITLNRVDQLFDNIVLATYVILAMASVLLLYAATAGKLPERFIEPGRRYAPLLAQYAFGGLLSGMLIFYGRSGSWSESWPFLLIIIGVIIGNEVLKERTSRLLFNIAVLFVGLFSYVVLIVPVVTGVMGAWVFFGSGVLALAVMYGFLRILALIVPKFIALHARQLIFTVGTLFLTFNILYFTNIIPPIPLSLKDVGIYHSVVKFETGEYRLTYEKPRWWEFLRDSDKRFRFEPGDNAFCFASVFAPARLETDIYHRWEFYDEDARRWTTHSRISYPIAGGRGQGFRGYTQIGNFETGKWRCIVETARGQKLGSETFRIEGGEVRELVTRTE
jgi:MFS family permease